MNGTDEATLSQPRHLIALMPDQGDLHLIIDGPFTYVDIGDLERLVTGETVPDGRGVATLPAALDWARSQGTTRAAEVIAWLEGFLATVDEAQLENAHRIPSFVDAVTVRKAAAMLDADPAISIGQSSLFEHMALIGWIERTGADAAWTLTPTARRFDWLTTRTVIVRRKHYRQVYVTPRGLAALQVSLHGMSGPPAEPAPQPTLFD